MKIVNGNLIELAKTDQFNMIVHGCNCFCTMGAGIAKQIKKHFPEAYKVDQSTKKGAKSKLGQISMALIPEYNLVVVNAYTQYMYGRYRRHVDYDAVESCFQRIAFFGEDKKIGYPKIGCNLGGGDWNVVSEIINRRLNGLNHTLVLPK